jgi:hypothetical protein
VLALVEPRPCLVSSSLGGMVGPSLRLSEGVRIRGAHGAKLQALTTCQAPRQTCWRLLLPLSYMQMKARLWQPCLMQETSTAKLPVSTCRRETLVPTYLRTGGTSDWFPKDR